MAGGLLPYDAPIRGARALDETEDPQSEVATSARAGIVPPDFVHLFKANYAAIWRLLRRLGVQSAHLDDTAQEVFWVAARKLTVIEPGREQAFLYGIALRVASQEHRRRSVTPPAAEAEALARLQDLQPSPEEQLEQRQARALLDAVLDQLPTELRTIFVLCELEELGVRDAAALQGIPIGTAGSRLRRAREEFSAIAKRVRATLAARRSPR